MTSKKFGRRQLLEILTVYTDAIVLKDTSAIPVAKNVRITCNGEETKLGDNPMWNMSGTLRIPYRRALVDAKRGAVMFRGTVTNEVIPRGSPIEMITNPPPGNWYWYALRLQVQNGQITEIEEILSTVGFPGTTAKSMIFPDRIWDMIVPEDQRSTEEELLQIADDYFSTVSGTIPWHKAPFHPEVNRYENGAATTNAVFLPGGTGTGLLSPALQDLKVTNRRFYCVDVTTGVVGALGKFTPPKRSDHVTRGAVSAVIFEEFKIQDGLIRHIEAFFNVEGQEYSGWGTGYGSRPGVE